MGPRRKATLRWWAPVLLATIATTAFARDPDARVRFVAGRGDVAINTDPGETIHPTPERDRLSIADDGSVMFTAEVRDASNAIVSSEVLVVGRRGELEILTGIGGAVPDDSVPGLAGFEVMRIDHARRTPLGDTVVECTTTDGLFQLRTLLTFVDGTPDVGAVEFFDFGGTCPLSRIGDGIFARPYALNGGTLTFYGSTRDDACGDTLLRMYSRPDGEDASIIVLEDGPVPGVPNETFEPLFGGPVANEDGDALFFGRYRNGGGSVVDLLVRAPVDGGPEIAASEGDLVGGTSAEIVGFLSWTIGIDDVVDGNPRVAYAAAAEVSPGPFPVGTSVHVFDSAIGGDPVLSTGDTAGTFAFATASIGATPVQIAVDPTDRVVVLADVSGPGITDAVPGVWRHDPAAAPPLSLVLRQGGPVPGAVGETRTVDRIFTVHASPFGVIAAEVELSDGKQAILLERAQTGTPGTFAVALEQGDTVDIDGADTTLTGIVNQPTNRPTLTRSGSDGLQSRFNDDGLFVFRGAASFGAAGSGSGVWTVTVEESKDPCDVDVSVEKGWLVVRSGERGCNLTIVSSTDGIVRVEPGDDTTINDEEAAWSGEFERGIDIRAGDGDDLVVLRSTRSLDDQGRSPDVPRDLVVDMGPGMDSLRLESISIAGSLTVKPGVGLQDKVDLVSCEIGRNLRLDAARGKSLYTLVDVVVNGKTKVGVGNAASVENLLTLRSCDMEGASIKGGTGGDRIDVDRCRFTSSLVIDPGRSVIDFVDVRGTTIEKGGLTIRGKRSTFLDLGLDGVEVSDGKIVVQAGSRGSQVTATNVTAAGALSVTTAGTTNPTDVHTMSFSNLQLDRVKLRGVGSHAIAFSGDGRIERGIKLTTKKSVADSVSVSQTRIPSGSLSVKSGADALELRLTGLIVDDGSVQLKATNGADQIFVTGSTIADRLKVAARGGDDTLTLSASPVAGDRTLDGGKDVDTLVIDAASTVGGKDKRKNIER